MLFLPPVTHRRGPMRGMISSSVSISSPQANSSDPGSVLRAAQGFLLQTRASWLVPRALSRPLAPPGYLQAGAVSTAPLSSPLGVSAAWPVPLGRAETPKYQKEQPGVETEATSLPTTKYRGRSDEARPGEMWWENWLRKIILKLLLKPWPVWLSD